MDIYEKQEKALIEGMNWLCRPEPGEFPSIRKMMEHHLERLVNIHNEELQDKVHYMETGEIPDGPRREALRYMPPRQNERDRNRVIQTLLHYRIDLGYVMYGLDGVSQHDELSDLSDAQFLEVYNRVLLQLRALRMPDPMPS